MGVGVPPCYHTLGIGDEDNSNKGSVKVYTMLALTKIKSREALFICPFNDAHHVQRGKYMNHIYHCQRNEAHRGFVKCQFHDGHWSPNQEFSEYHMSKECPDAKEQTRQLCEEKNYFGKKSVQEKIFRPEEYDGGW